MERRKIVKFLKELETDFRGTESQQFLNVQDLINDLSRFYRIHGPDLFLRVSDYEAEWNSADVELVTIKDETDEELEERKKQVAHDVEQFREQRRQQYEHLRQEFEKEK